jgi:hypothetical protein
MEEVVGSIPTGKLVRLSVPTGWACAPIRDYLIGDATAMLLSHLAKEEKGKHESNPPTMPSKGHPRVAERLQNIYQR